MEYEAIVCGLGAMGSAAAYHLASAGLRVLGLDRFHPPHDHGSSHGKTRIIREAYFEDPAYVPLVQHAYGLWKDLEKESGHQLLLETGGLMIGSPNGILVGGARRSAEEHRLAHRLLSASELHKEFPALATKEGEVAVWEPRAGILFPEVCIQAHLDLASRKGAVLRFGEKVVKWEPHGQGVRVTTESGVFTARHLLLSAGAWLTSLVPELDLPLSVERQVLFWFEPKSGSDSSEERSPSLLHSPPGSWRTTGCFRAERFPIFIWENEPRKFFYGFPDLGDGVKIGVHHEGETTEPDRLNREVSKQEIDHAYALVRRHLPEAAGEFKSAVVCMYTNTPDEHFILDYHPVYPQVVIASPCSGHGFKFSPVIGEIASAILQGGNPAFDLALFRLGRFGA